MFIILRSLLGPIAKTRAPKMKNNSAEILQTKNRYTKNKSAKNTTLKNVTPKNKHDKYSKSEHNCPVQCLKKDVTAKSNICNELF